MAAATAPQGDLDLGRLLQGALGSRGEGSAAAAPELTKQAAQLWAMLDEMADNDPEGYKQFLAEQAKQAGVPPPGQRAPGGSAPPPRPSLVLHAAVETSGRAHGRAVLATEPDEASAAMFRTACGSVDLNVVRGGGASSAQSDVTAVVAIYRDAQVDHPVCHGKAVTPAIAEQDLKYMHVPFKARRPPFRVAAESGPRQVYELSVHPVIVDLALRPTPPSMAAYLVEHACRFVESAHGCVLSRSQRSLQVASEELPADQVARFEEQRRASIAAASSKGTSAEALPPSLLTQLAGLAPGDSSRNNNTQPGRRLPSKPRGPLVQELDDSDVVSTPKMPPANEVPATSAHLSALPGQPSGRGVRNAPDIVRDNGDASAGARRTSGRLDGRDEGAVNARLTGVADTPKPCVVESAAATEDARNASAGDRVAWDASAGRAGDGAVRDIPDKLAHPSTGAAAEACRTPAHTVSRAVDGSGIAWLELAVEVPPGVAVECVDVLCDGGVVVSVPHYQAIRVEEDGFDYGRLQASFKKKGRQLRVRCPAL